jgi:hypothetical protein
MHTAKYIKNSANVNEMHQVHIGSLPLSLILSDWHLVEFSRVSGLPCQIFAAFSLYISVHPHKSHYSVCLFEFLYQGTAFFFEIFHFKPFIRFFLSSFVFLLMLKKMGISCTCKARVTVLSLLMLQWTHGSWSEHLILA